MCHTLNELVSKDLIYSLKGYFLVEDDKSAVNEFRMPRVEGDLRLK